MVSYIMLKFTDKFYKISKNITTGKKKVKIARVNLIFALLITQTFGIMKNKKICFSLKRYEENFLRSVTCWTPIGIFQNTLLGINGPTRLPKILKSLVVICGTKLAIWIFLSICRTRRSRVRNLRLVPKKSNGLP